MLQNIFCGRVVVGLGDAKSNVNVYHFSEDYEGPDVRVPRWSIEPEDQVQVREVHNLDIAVLFSLRAGPHSSV